MKWAEMSPAEKRAAIEGMLARGLGTRKLTYSRAAKEVGTTRLAIAGALFRYRNPDAWKKWQTPTTDRRLRHGDDAYVERWVDRKARKAREAADGRDRD